MPPSIRSLKKKKEFEANFTDGVNKSLVGQVNRVRPERDSTVARNHFSFNFPVPVGPEETNGEEAGQGQEDKMEHSKSITIPLSDNSFRFNFS